MALFFPEPINSTETVMSENSFSSPNHEWRLRYFLYFHNSVFLIEKFKYWATVQDSWSLVGGEGGSGFLWIITKGQRNKPLGQWSEFPPITQGLSTWNNSLLKRSPCLSYQKPCSVSSFYGTSILWYFMKFFMVERNYILFISSLVIIFAGAGSVILKSKSFLFLRMCLRNFYERLNFVTDRL